MGPINDGFISASCSVMKIIQINLLIDYFIQYIHIQFHLSRHFRRFHVFEPLQGYGIRLQFWLR